VKVAIGMMYRLWDTHHQRKAGGKHGEREVRTIVNRRKSTCTGGKCMIGWMHGMADDPVLDESCVPLWRVCKLSQRSRM
jgi:hypothetical protein